MRSPRVARAQGGAVPKAAGPSESARSFALVCGAAGSALRSLCTGRPSESLPGRARSGVGGRWGRTVNEELDVALGPVGDEDLLGGPDGPVRLQREDRPAGRFRRYQMLTYDIVSHTYAFVGHKEYISYTMLYVQEYTLRRRWWCTYDIVGLYRIRYRRFRS